MSLPDLLSLTWESQSSDIRDKFYGVLGLSSLKPGGIPVRPDYGISLQHMLIGFFAHCIIGGGTPQLLLKAWGASTEPGVPSWVPDWKGDDAWKRLFGTSSEENPSWGSVVGWLVAVKQSKEYARDSIGFGNWNKEKKYRLVRFISNSSLKGKMSDGRTVFDRRPWYRNATVDSDSGVMYLNLTRLTSINETPVRVDPSKEGWYRVYCTNIYSSDQFIYVMSRNQLDAVAKVGDEVFLLDTNVSAPIYLILRKTGKHGIFRLIAACLHLVFFFFHPENERLSQF